jgi:N-acetylglutamate synthase-like GNAT family acetyltransferase
MIQKCNEQDFTDICTIINDGAAAYKGIIPADRWHEPYMPDEDLQKQINEGVQFWSYKEDNQMLGVMGIQYKGDVTLIRHAYVRTANRSQGIGGKLLLHLISISTTPILIGTWSDATWAIGFYQNKDFRLVSDVEKERLLRKYWSIPERQIETSVVLASKDWNDGN